MKVVHLNTYTEGGAAQAALRINDALLKQCFGGLSIESKFLALYNNQNKVAIDFRDELNVFENYFLKLKNKLRALKLEKKYYEAEELFSELETVWEVKKHSLIKNSDILHLHWISSFVDIPSFFHLQNKKIVWTLHDYFPFSGGFHYPINEIKEEWFKKIELQKDIIEKIFSETKIDFVFPSEYLKQIAKDSNALGNNNCQVIKNPVDVNLFKPLDKNACRDKHLINKTKPVLFFLSDYFNYPRKGFALLAKALSLINKEVTLITAGRGKLPSVIGKAEIKYFGLVQNNNLLVELYNCADLLVNPSLADISSNTVIEAMACGIPSVTFATGGIPELITEVNGIIANETSAQALAESINLALSKNYDPGKIKSLAEQNHSFEVIGKKYATLYSPL